jgi:hypothetical protein
MQWAWEGLDHWVTTEWPLWRAALLPDVLISWSGHKQYFLT